MGETSGKRALVLAAGLALLLYSLLPSGFASATPAGARHTPVTNPGPCGAVVVTLPLPPTATPTLTATPTSTPKPHRKRTATPTETPVPTDTPAPTDTPQPVETPTDTPVPTDTPTETPSTPIAIVLITSTPTPMDTPIPTDTPVPTDTPLPSDTPTETPTSTPLPTETPIPVIIFPPFATNTVGPFTTVVPAARRISRQPAGVLAARSGAPSKPKLPAHPNITCVWTSGDSIGHPLLSFAHGKPVYLLAAWQLGSRRDLSHDAVVVRWDVYHVYQRDVSLMPSARYRYFEQWAGLPVTPKAGSFRLTFAPVLVNPPKGWYSLVARAYLYGPHCDRAGCAGQARQTRFYVH